MVYSPSSYLLSAAVAAIALQIQQTKAGSMYYEPVTVSSTTETLGPHFPGYGAEVLDEDCTFTVEVDPTLPDITTIPNVPVVYMDLLANTSVPFAEPVFTKVGKVIMSEETPANGTNPDAYIDSDIPLTGAVKGEKENLKDCATGWEETDNAVDKKTKTKRRLEAASSQDLAKLEKYFGTKFELKLANLPTVAVHRPTPWAGPYWPTVLDSINVVWKDGEPSPAEKYATAYGYDVKEFMDRVSRIDGIDGQTRRLECDSNIPCEYLEDQSICGIRPGASTGRCIPVWFGICHAWAAASILELEPKCPVTHNGVTFYPLDIKGLITSIYDGTNPRVIYTGARFHHSKHETDMYGRSLDPSFRDINPAFFHIVTTNLLGKLNTTFVADIDPSQPIWNHPIRAFKVFEQTAMSLEEAAQTFYGLEKYPWNADANSIVYVKLRLSWIVETFEDGGHGYSGRINEFTTGKFYFYLLELNVYGEIIGGEWVSVSDSDHPDFLWVTAGKPDPNAVTKTGLSYAEVSMLLKKSVACTDSA